ncbi:hypothetical protein GCM10022289_10360 [Pedobacter jeongneungensis]|uniref:LTD domain-containing protein n=1 Tax=Pedobacter jeongneungensis TaxID=947309 RepID=A0ABP8B884_9SPHI
MKIKLLTLLILIGIGAKAQTYKPDRQHNLVVVYLIPQDITPLPNYEERISKALLYGQEFFRQQMIQQGFGDKTFGLIKDNAMQRVQICTVKSNKPASQLSNAGAVKNEADAYLALPENVGKNTSQHMLIITPYDNKLYGGWGKYCIVYDNLGLDMNNPNKDNLALWVGGMLHELGHALQLQHNNEPFPVGGDMRSQNEPKSQAKRFPNTYRPTLMGIGNYSLEVFPNNPTILTKADCAMLDVCEILNDVTIPTYYGEASSAVDIIHGNYNTATQNLEFSGKFLNSSPANPVKHIGVFLDPNVEGEGEGANHDYNAISYETEPIGTDSFSIALPLSGLSYQGNTTYEVKIKLIHANGYITQGIAHIYFDANVPGLATEFAPKNITRADRTNWTITPGNKIIGGSTKIDEDANGNIGLATNIIDNNPNTTWNSYNDAKTMYPHQVTIDTKTQQDYVGISYLHKKGLSNAIKNIELYGSNTGKEGDFVLLKTDVLGRSDGGKYISFNKKENFRYFRFVAISPQNSNDGWAYLAELNLWQGPDPINQTKPANTLVSRNGWTIRAGNKLKPDNVTTYEDENKTTPDGQSAVNESAESAIDGRDRSGWESNYDTYFPHELIIDTKSVQRFTGWSYNQLYDMYVMVKDVDILVSDDDVNYTLVGSYTLNYNNGVNQINFEPRNFRYFKFVTKNAFDGLQYAAIAELNLYNDPTVKGNVPSPALKVNQTAFDFGSQNTGTNSTVQTFNLNATGLTDAVNITTTAPFYLSKDNITYSTSLVYTAAELAADKTVSVRFSPTTASAASGTISISSTGATTLNITATGVATTPPATPAHIVISEIYGGGGNSGATYKNDFIELYNPGNTAVDLTGWSVQYTSATGAGNWTATNLSGAIAPKGFYLVQEAAGAGGTVDLPTPDKIGTLNLSGTTGKVLLSNSVTLQTGANPTGANIIDKVGFGTANGFEGTAPATATTNSTSIERKASATSDATTMGTGGTEEFAGNGYDSDDNSLDFILRPPNPQNTSVTEPASTSGPNLVVTPKTLAFGNQAINTTSAPKTYVLSAGNLTNATTLTTTAPYSISKDNITFSSTLTYSVADLATNQTVYVKFSPTVAGNSTGAILHESTGATSVSLSLTGLAVDPSQTAFNFENCTTAGSAALSDGFYQYSVTGAQTWACTTTFGHDPADPTGVANTGNALQINGYSGGNILNEDWLISPALNISSFNYAILSFYTRSAFAGDKLQLKISTNYTGSGDPALATWTSLDGKFPETGTDKWTKSDNIDLSAYKATPVYVAIVYNSTTSSASRWTVDDFVVTNSNTPPAVDITTSPSSISFGFQAANTTSAASTFGFSAGNLTDDVTLTAPANFTLSKTSTGTYSSTITYPKADINNTSPTVYAKFSPATVNTSYTGNVNIATAGSANKTVALSGNTFDAANTLEVVNWNIEWFGSPAQNPSNDAQQAANVKTVVNNLNADIYGFAEVVDTTLFRNTVLPAGYNVLFSDFGSYADNKADADYPLAQKLAFMYRTDLIKPISTLGILRDTYNPAVPATSADGSPYKNWSSGRFPYLMQAQVKINNKPDTVYFVEIHAKANTGTTADQIDAYNRRKAGNKQLKDWLDLNLAGKKVIILGDFNDVLDADKTIAPMPGTGTSYSDFTLDAANYFPVTLPLSLAGKQSTAGFNTVIDNVIITKNLNLNYIPASAEVLDAVKNLVSNYSTTTTDHYPVKTRYLFGNGAPTLDAIADQAICYAPANQTIALTGISAGPETTQNTTLSVTADNASLFDVLTIAANGTGKGTITYHLKNNISGEANITITVLDDGGTDFGGVNKITKSFKLKVTSTATATVTGTAAVCLNDADQTITFTGANGTAPYTFTYNVNGGADQTVSTTGTSSSVTVSVPGNVEGTFAYNLLNVKDVNCGQAQSGTATITVRALATASISGSATVPKLAAAPDITFTGANGTAPYTFTYNINGGANKTVTSTGNTATISVPTSAAGTFIYNLVSVADVNCSQPQTGSAMVTVNALPAATIAGNASV